MQKRNYQMNATMLENVTQLQNFLPFFHTINDYLTAVFQQFLYKLINENLSRYLVILKPPFSVNVVN